MKKKHNIPIYCYKLIILLYRDKHDSSIYIPPKEIKTKL